MQFENRWAAQTGCAAILHIFGFWGALAVFDSHFSRPGHRLHRSVRLLFALSWTVSAALLALPLLELLSLIDHAVRYLVWTVDMWILVALVYLVIPFTLVVATCSTTSNVASYFFIAVGCAMLLPALWFVFHKFGGEPLEIPRESLSVEHLTGRVAMCGVFMAASLSGFGSVMYPYQNMKMFEIEVSENHLSDLREGLLQASRKLDDKKGQLSLREFQRGVPLTFPDIEQSSPLSRRGGSTPRRGLGGSIVEWWKGKDAVSETLKAEIRDLTEIYNQLKQRASEAAENNAKAVGSTMCRNFLGYIMVAVCMYRVAASTTNVVLRRTAKADPAALALEFAFHNLKIPIDVQFWSPYASLVLMGVLIVLTARGFVERVVAIFKVVTISSTVYSLILSEVAGLYFAACGLLMRMYLPEQHRQLVTEVIGPSLKYEEFHLRFDLVFVISCIGALLLVMYSHAQKYTKFKDS